MWKGYIKLQASRESWHISDRNTDRPGIILLVQPPPERILPNIPVDEDILFRVRSQEPPELGLESVGLRLAAEGGSALRPGRRRGAEPRALRGQRGRRRQRRASGR